MRISELTTRSAKLNTGTAYFAVDQSSDTVTNKIDYAELAKQIVTEYNAQTLAGTAQSVKAALDTIGANYKNLGATTAIPSNSDLNNYTTPGSYSAQSDAIAATITNAPITRAFTLDVENALGISSSAWRRQIVRASASPDDVYQRFTGGNTWSDWKKVPTRTEMDAVSTVETITAEVNTEEVSTWVFVIKKCGNVVSINGYANLKNPTKTSTNFTIATLPENARPLSTIRTIACIASQAYLPGNNAYLAVNQSTGELSVRLPEGNTGNFIYTSLAYIV